MFMSLLSRILSAWFAFFLPCYATYKTLSSSPASEPDLKRWSMYWVVMGVFVTFEYLAEWLISWLPFYWEMKTIFLLFLSLPQTQGSTFVYTTYLQPFFAKNEVELDAGILSIQTNMLIFLKSQALKLWNLVWGAIGEAPNAGQIRTSVGQLPVPTLSLESATGLWHAYGSSVMNAIRPAKTTPEARVPAGSLHVTDQGTLSRASSETSHTTEASGGLPVSESDGR